jgi:hypothetical protein
VLAVLGWGLCWAELADHMGSAALSVLLFGLPMAGMGLLASVRAAASRRNLVAISTVAALLTVVGACAVDFGTIAAFGCILFGVAVAVWGASVRAIVRTLMGSGVALFGLGVQVWLAVHHDNVLRWASLSVAGVLLIVGSAYLERHRGRLLRYWDAAALRRQRQREALQL